MGFQAGLAFTRRLSYTPGQPVGRTEPKRSREMRFRARWAGAITPSGLADLRSQATARLRTGPCWTATSQNGHQRRDLETRCPGGSILASPRNGARRSGGFHGPALSSLSLANAVSILGRVWLRAAGRAEAGRQRSVPRKSTRNGVVSETPQYEKYGERKKTGGGKISIQEAL